MILEKATEVLADLLGDGPYHDPDDRRQAVQLGIEALKVIIAIRDDDWRTSVRYLPGETVAGRHGPLTDDERDIVDREYQARKA